MSKSTRNSGKTWEHNQVSTLRELAVKNTPTRVIGLKLGEQRTQCEAKQVRKEYR